MKYAFILLAIVALSVFSNATCVGSACGNSTQDIQLVSITYEDGLTPSTIRLIATLQNVGSGDLGSVNGTLDVNRNAETNSIWSQAINEASWPKGATKTWKSGELGWNAFENTSVRLKGVISFPTLNIERDNGNTLYTTLFVPKKEPISAPDVPFWMSGLVGMGAILLMMRPDGNKKNRTN